MDQSMQIIIIAALLVVVVLILTTSKNGRKFETEHKKDIFKTNLIIKIADVLTILFLCASAFLALKSVLSNTAGYILMVVFFLCWLPFQFWSYTYVFMDEEGITYFSPSGKNTCIIWKDVKLVSSGRFGIVVRSAASRLRVYSFFTGFEKIKQSVFEHCPGKF